MLSKQWLAVAAWVFLPVAATAQQQAHYAPADPTAPVTVSGYESAFKSYRTSGEESQTPDKIWRSANEEMGSLGGHAGQMKGSASRPAASPGADTAAPKHDSATDHSKHH